MAFMGAYQVVWLVRSVTLVSVHGEFSAVAPEGTDDESSRRLHPIVQEKP